MKTTLRPLSLALLMCSVAAGCVDLRPPDAGNDGASPNDAGVGRIVSTDKGDGTTQTDVDATSETDYVYFDFESQREVAPGTPGSSAAWDIAFERFKIKVNGGTSGTGNVAVAALPNATFATLTTAPPSGYASDDAPPVPDGGVTDGGFTAGSEGLIFHTGDGWYSYDPVNHVLAPRPIVYVVRSVEGRYYKVQITGYYDQAGTPGYLGFRWAPIDAPSGNGTFTVDATSATEWTYVRIASGAVVTVTSPEASTDWDLAFRRAQIQTNSGTTGSGVGGAQLQPAGATYDATTHSPTVGFVPDSLLPIPGPPGSGTFSGSPVLSGTDGTDGWYDYNPSTHTVTPKPSFFLVRTAQGEYGKLQITAYAGGVYTIKVALLVRRVDVQTIDVNASSTTTRVYLNLRNGKLVTVATPESDRSWDLAIQRTLFQTNSGTSGGGTGGAADPRAVELSEIASAENATFAVDSQVPIPGPPGSGTVSGNLVLNGTDGTDGWYDYDPSTRTATPKNKSFLIRTADGGFVKFKITRYSGGQYGLSWAYAGPNRTDF